MISKTDLLNALFDKEIVEIRHTISNESLWEAGYDGDRPNPHTGNIAFLYSYLGLLKSLRKGSIDPETVSETANALDDGSGINLLNTLFNRGISEAREKTSQITAGIGENSYSTLELVSVYGEYIDCLVRMSSSLITGAQTAVTEHT